MSIKFYTWTHDANHKNLDGLKESAEKHHIQINYLGSHLKSFGTTMTKVKLLYEAVCRLDESEIVCAVDAFDVFFCAGEEVIEQTFLSFDCNCVVSVERAYSHQYKKYKKYYDQMASGSPYRYINSGSIIGYAGALKKIYAPTLSTTLQAKIFTIKVIKKIKSVSRIVKRIFNLKNLNENFVYSLIYYTDQQHIGKYVATNPGNLRIKLDHETKIFWCAAFEWEDIDDHFRVEDVKVINRHTNNAPLIIHVPGWRVYGNVLTKLYKIQQALS